MCIHVYMYICTYIYMYIHRKGPSVRLTSNKSHADNDGTNNNNMQTNAYNCNPFSIVIAEIATSTILLIMTNSNNTTNGNNRSL